MNFFWRLYSFLFIILTSFWVFQLNISWRALSMVVKYIWAEVQKSTCILSKTCLYTYIEARLEACAIAAQRTTQKATRSVVRGFRSTTIQTNPWTSQREVELKIHIIQTIVQYRTTPLATGCRGISIVLQRQFYHVVRQQPELPPKHARSLALRIAPNTHLEHGKEGARTQHLCRLGRSTPTPTPPMPHQHRIWFPPCSPSIADFLLPRTTRTSRVSPRRNMNLSMWNLLVTRSLFRFLLIREHWNTTYTPTLSQKIQRYLWFQRRRCKNSNIHVVSLIRVAATSLNSFFFFFFLFL